MKNRIVLSKMLFSASVFIVIAVCGCSGSKFTSSEVTEDLVFLKEKIGSVHPNPYYSLPQQDFVHSIDSLIEALSDKNKVSQKEVFCMLNPVVASLHDAHTRLILPNKILLRSFLWGSKVIPVDVSIDNGKIYVNNNVSKTVIEPGSEIISINDVPAIELLNTIKRNKYGDSDAMRSYGINNKTFPRELWLYLGFNKHFSLRVISPGGVENQVSLKGIYQPSFYKRIGKLYPHKPTKLIDSDNGYYYT